MPSILTLPGKIVNRGGTFFLSSSKRRETKPTPPPRPWAGSVLWRQGKARSAAAIIRAAHAARKPPACSRLIANGGLTKGQIGVKL